IMGVPIITNAGFTTARLTSDFTVRVTNGLGKIADRSFSISINGLVPPSIIPDGGHLGTFFDGTYLDIQLTAVDPNPEIPLVWSFDSGELPIGIKLTSDGRLQGYLFQYTVPGSLGSNTWDRLKWDEYLWDFSDTPQNHTYEFVLSVFDGLHTDKAKYTLTVLSKSSFTIDNTLLTADTDIITVDSDTRHLPIIVTENYMLPETRQLSEYAFKFTAFDFDNDSVYYYVDVSEPGMSLPAGLNLDPETGWLTGNVGSQVEDEKIYTFNVYAVKRFYPSFIGPSKTFSLKVYGSVDNYINWITPQNLGVIENGIPSELQIQASSPTGKIVQFRIKPGTRSRLPQGLQFQNIYFWDANALGYSAGSIVIRNEQYYRARIDIIDSGIPPEADPNKWDQIDYSEVQPGLITGRPTIAKFSLDKGATTIDNNTTVWDNTYTFTVEAYTINDSVRSTRTFSVKIINRNERPFENLYLKALISKDERKLFESIINEINLFPNELIYRINDPWFGKAKNIKFLFLPGINPSYIDEYISAMRHNHYNKYIEMGDVKTAVVVDEFRRPVYEVVYVEVKDTLSENGKNPKQSLDLTKINANPWFDEKGNPYRLLEPNGFDNMKTAVINPLGYSNQGALPTWMTSVQPDGRVLGFVHAVVLAYTVPGASKLIAYRLKNNGITFKNLNFVVDRYQLDNIMSKFYDIDLDRFIDSPLTTFDRLPSVDSNLYFAGGVAYALTVPFESINGRYKFEIDQAGRISGVTNYTNGELVVFVKQEQYDNYTGEADGWFYTVSEFDNEPFDSTSFSETYYIPGYFESTASNLTKIVAQNASSGSITLELNSIVGVEIGSRVEGAGIERAAYIVDILGSTIILDRPIFDNISAGQSIVVSPVLNQRGGIWRIKIDPITTIVNLEFVKEILPNDWVQINKGRNFVDTKFYYDITIKPGKTQPEYSLFEAQIGQETIFDGGATRFYDNRDQYTLPEKEDKYLKFPKLGVFK
ncbi:MAG: putative Ig domain-containing protein, partial [Fischerella sp.]|nr:putative Ig domain-containing protein [Fischerella sp.]